MSSVASYARSKAEFIAIVGVVHEEADESHYWMELLAEADVVRLPLLEPLMLEAQELKSIMITSQRTAKGRTSEKGSR